MTKNIRAAFYGRASTSKQETSVPDQRQAVAGLAAKEGYQIVAEFVDDGISGDDTERRTQFQAMLKAAQTGGFEVILCWSQDRFGRFDPLEAGYWIKPLRDAGVRLETVAEGKIDWDSFAGRIVYSVAQEGKHAFLRDLSRASARGMARKAREGGWLGGKAPYGYRLTAEGKLALGDPIEVETVRWLFRTYATTSTSIGELVNILNEKGIPSPGEIERRAGKVRSRPEGLLWCKTSLQKILVRPVYLGHTVWNRRHEGRYYGIGNGGEVVQSRKRKNSVVPNDPSEWLVVEGTHEPLTDRETFDTVQRRLAENRVNTAPKRKGNRYLFTGLLRCGHCGWPMHGCALTDNRPEGEPRRYQRYVCGNYNLHGATVCQCNTVAEWRVLVVLVRKLVEAFTDPERVALVTAELRRQFVTEAASGQVVDKALDRRIAELETQIAQGNRNLALLPEDVLPGVVEQVRLWREERDRLARQKAVSNPAPSEADIDQAIERIVSRLAVLQEKADRVSPAVMSELVHEMVERIELWFRHVPYGRVRQRSVLDRGTVELREDLLVSSLVPRGSPLTMV
jgi:site-specific DNA recombinase